jgi:hypothetical protein
VATAIKYKRVTNSGDHVSVISDDTLELDNCSPNNDTFFNKNILTGTSSGEEETAQRFPLKSPRSNHFLSTDICGPVKCTPAGRRYIIVFVCLSSGVYFASTSRTQVVGTPAVNKDVDAYASYQANFASVPDLPVSPTKLVYDIVNPKTNFDVTGLAPWYNFNDHGLTPVVQLQPLSYNSTCHPGPAAADANQPAIQLQPESDCDSLWTTFTRYVSDASPLLPSHFKAVRYVIAPWNQGNLGGLYSFFSANTAASRSGGGKGCLCRLRGHHLSSQQVPDEFQHRLEHCRLRPGHASPAARCTNQQDRVRQHVHFQTEYHRTTTRTPNSSQPRTP